MSSADINDKIASIHDQTLSTLRALGLPPLPHHYKKHFDQIVRQSEDSELIALQNDDFVSSEELTRYLDIAHRSIEAFVETHADISHVAQLQENYISKTPKEGIERCVQFVDGLSELGHNMSVELKKAQNKIDTLHNELQETITQLTIDPLTKVTNRKGLIDDLHSVIQAGQTKTLPTV